MNKEEAREQAIQNATHTGKTLEQAEAEAEHLKTQVTEN